MSFGREKRTPAPPPRPPEPPRITRVETLSPLGDQVVTEEAGNVQRTFSKLSTPTRRILDTSRNAVQGLATQLASPDSTRQRDLQRLQEDLFSSQAAAINSASDRSAGAIRSQNAQRFGGALNATFGNQLLGELEGQRQRSLADARLESDLIARELENTRTQSRIQRLQVFQGLLNNSVQPLFNSNRDAAQVLDNARDRSLRRIEALERQSQNQERQRQTRRSAFGSTFGSLLGGVGGFLLGGPAGAAAGAGLGGTLGSSFS